MLYDFPTDKQCSTLRFITNILDVYFSGTTKSEAREFIMKYLDKAHEVYKKQKEEKHKSYEEYDENEDDYCELNASNYFTNINAHKTYSQKSTVTNKITETKNSHPWDNGWGEEEWWN